MGDAVGSVGPLVEHSLLRVCCVMWLCFKVVRDALARKVPKPATLHTRSNIYFLVTHTVAYQQRGQTFSSSSTALLTPGRGVVGVGIVAMTCADDDDDERQQTQQKSMCVA